MKRIILYVFAACSTYVSTAQELDLQTCLELALKKSALSSQRELYQQLAEVKTSRLSKGYLPQLSVSGQWSYQSDVFALPFSPPGGDIPQIPKSQYQATAAIEQSIFDGGTTARAKEATRLETAANQAKLEVDLFKVKESVVTLYFGVLRAQESERSLQTARNTLLEKQKEVDAAYEAGIVLTSDKASFEKEVLAVEQQLIVLQAEKEALIGMLADKTGVPLEPSVRLELPAPVISDEQELARPELTYLQQQQLLVHQNAELIAARAKPKLSAFVRGGAGSPNPYNFFETDLNSFYIGGVRLSWQAFDWGANRQEREELLLQEKILESSRRGAEDQFENGLAQWRKKWEAADEIIARDTRIIELLQSVVDEYELRLDGGTVTSAEYITALDQLTRAKTTARLHQIDKAWYQIQYLTLTGKL